MMRRNKVADRGAQLPFGVHRGEIARRERWRTMFVRFHPMWSTSDVQLRFFPRVSKYYVLHFMHAVSRSHNHLVWVDTWRGRGLSTWSWRFKVRQVAPFEIYFMTEQYDRTGR